jgi:hypothetical protein
MAPRKHHRAFDEILKPRTFPGHEYRTRLSITEPELISWRFG